jgi:predicted Zn finger-like uncharacterized protein
MLPTRVACPHCRAALKTAHALPEGQRVKCPTCGTRFTVGANQPVPAPAWASPPADALRAGPPPLPFGPGTTARPGIRWLALLLILLGGLTFVGGGVALALYIFSGGNAARPKPELADAGPGAKGDTGKTNPQDAGRPDGDSAHKEKPPPGKKSTPAKAKPRRPQVRLGRGQQKQVDQAVNFGVAYLRSTQNGDGTWTGANDTLPSNPAGMTALVGLTLLECGAKKNDPAVQKVAAYLRRREQSADKIARTYEIALAILFFDRIHDAQDQSTIPRLALRLVAGQNPSGGWTYVCPVLSDDENRLLAQLLDQSKPQFSAETTASKLQLEPVDPSKLRLDGAAAVPATLANLAVWRADTDPGGQWVSDNSNTQFAILGLWAAKSQGLPLQRSLALLVKRFDKAQNADGSWGYQITGPGAAGTPAMTCAGLLGLAVGQGLVNEVRTKAKVAPRVAHKDPAIQKGLQYLAAQLANPHNPWENASGAPQAPLYYTWSVERVGVIYGLARIGGKDWYGWGAEKLVANQRIEGDKGHWDDGGYYAQHPVINTCFALLFLKQANLAKDLTAKLQLAEDSN